MTRNALAILALVGGLFAMPASAEVVRSEEGHFVTRDEAVVEADPKATWLALISPADWWSAEHTWTGEAGNLSLMPKAGGCFCETIPEMEDTDRITLEGSVEHMRVVQAHPERALRMVGALGPLQSEPVTGVLTIALTEVDEGTRIVWEYNVGGPLRYESGAIAQAVDGVMSLQLAGLAEMLGRIEGAAIPEDAFEDGAGEATDGSADGDADLDAASEARDTDSVEDAFGDLSDG